MEKMDYKKAFKNLYQPGTEPVILEVPPILYILTDGKGDPAEEDGEYKGAVELLYAVAYTIKMMPKSGEVPPGYFEYVVPPLEGLWWLSDYERDFSYSEKDRLMFTSMIRQPEFVTEEVFQKACETVRKKKKLETEKVRLDEISEGLCVQCLHIGPYIREPETVAKMKKHAAENGYAFDLGDERMHHEIYLSDPRKTDTEKMKTVLRYPLKRI